MLLLVSTCMKQLSIIVLIAFIFISCKKDNAALVRKELAGEWEYVTISGYPFSNPVLPPGNGIIIVFGENGNFERRNHDTLVFKGNYRLHERKDCSGDEKKTFLDTNDSMFVKDDYVNIRDGRLHISTPNCYQDGGTAIYRRL